MAKRSQHDSGEERVTAKSRPMMNLIARAPSHVSSSTSVSPGKRSYGNQDSWSTIAEKEERSGRPDIGIDRMKASDHYYHEQFMESFSSASYSKWDDDRVWSCQEWKTDTEMYERSGRPDETSWRATREIRLGFSHGETLHDGTAQSVVNEVMPRDRSGRPDKINSQEGAWPQQSVIGNDEAELELSVESRSFVNRVNDQVRKRQKRISNVTQNAEKTFYDLVNVHVCYNGISRIHWKELPEQTIVNPLGTRQISHSNKCSTYLRDWCLNKMRSQDWKPFVWRIIHGNICHELVMKESSIFSARRSTSFRILCCALGRFSKILNLTMHGSKD